MGKPLGELIPLSREYECTLVEASPTKDYSYKAVDVIFPFGADRFTIGLEAGLHDYHILLRQYYLLDLFV